MTKSKYLLMCEQLGNEPKVEEIPLEFSDFPYIVQVAMSIFSMLPDVYDGMSGTYMGKNYSLLSYVSEAYEIDNKQELLMYLNMIGNIIMEKRSKEQKQKQKKPKKVFS